MNKETQGPAEKADEMWLSWSVKWLETEATGNTHITCKLRQLLPGQVKRGRTSS